MKALVIATFSLLACFLIVNSGFGTTYYVNGTTGDDTYDGLAATWDGTHGPKATIQAGINASTDTDTVIVADGTYTGDSNRDLDFAGRAITLQSQNGAETCLINCQGTEADLHRGFDFHSGEDANSVVDGFTIRNGFVSGYPSYGGGGIYCRESSPTIINCTISSNFALYCGGAGICCEDSSPTITNCTISSNETYAYGGGIRCNENSDPVITNCTISGNRTKWSGGGIFCCHNSSPTITDCTISDNTAGEYGGGIYCEDNSGPTITNCRISDNTVGKYGGGIICYGSSPPITNCTISGNSADDFGGGIHLTRSNPTITNCILWANAAGNGHEIASTSTAHPSRLTVKYSDVEGGAAEAYVEPGCTLDLDGTNIDSDPLFVSGPYGDYYLSHTATGQAADSPCIDAGSDTAVNLGLDQLTTRIDSEYDTDVVDMGYHAPPTIWINSIAQSGDDITIEWKARAGFSYVVEWSADCEFGTYTEVPVGATYSWTDVGGALLPQKYYRVREQ